MTCEYCRIPEHTWCSNCGDWLVIRTPLYDMQCMERDAARYRWLRERDLETIKLGGVFAGLTPDNMVLNGEDLDDAIDSAMSTKHEPDELEIMNARLLAHNNNLKDALEQALTALDWYRESHPGDDSQADDEFRDICKELLGHSI